MDALLQLIRDTDYSAILKAREVRITAVADLQILARDEDAEVRELALRCLIESSNPEIPLILAEALFDEDVQVQAVALKGLHRRPDPSVRPALMQVLYRSEDPYVKQQVALIIGRMGAAAHPDELSMHCQTERDPQVREGCMVAMARLGEPAAREAFIERLQASAHRERARFLDYCSYIGAPWVLPPLIPLLDDETPMVRIGVDALPRAVHYLRACDLVVELVVALSGQPFSFAIGGPTHYDHPQREEVRHYLKTLSR